MRLEIDNLELQAGSFHLGPIRIGADAGEYLVILGPTGAGKTLTLEAIAGLRPVAAGRIYIDGRDLTDAAPEDRSVGLIHQEGLLFPHLTVRANVAYGTRRIPRAERAAQIARIAAMLEIEPILDRMPRGLSGGERQRVALARSLAARPALLLLDEPMAALDPNSRDSLRRTLLGLHRELGTTAVHVTHSFSEARELADRIAILIGGRILQTGRSGEVFSKPETGQIAQFLGTAALAPDPSEASGTAPILELRGLTIRNGRNAMPQLAAETAAFEDGAAGTGGLVPARILSAERQGSRVRVRINAGIDLEAALDLEPVSADRLAPGSTVWLRVANG